MRLTLVRHGQTEKNVSDVLQGPHGGNLTPLGVEQAIKVGLRLRDEKFDLIYSSDSDRVLKTAVYIVKFHKDTCYIKTKDLREIDVGPHEGEPCNSIDWDNRPADIESRESICKRAHKVFTEAYTKYPNGNVLFITHGGIIRALIRVLYKQSEHYMENIGPFQNCSVTIYQINSDEARAIAFNDVSHLDGLVS